MGADDVRFFCYFDGELIDEDRNAKYNGGKTKLIKVPKSIGFTSFKEKIEEMTKLPLNGTEFKIKCGVPADEFTVITVDVDDDESLLSVMEDSKFVRTYILKDVPPATTFTAAQREDLVLPTAAVQFPAENTIDGTSNHNPVEIKSIGVKPPENDGMSTSRDALPTGSELREWFPEKLLPFITGYGNPSSDGNCGFRALCMALGRNEREWAWMRDSLVKEIESNRFFYNRLFPEEVTGELLERTRHSHGPAPESRWMLMPYTGFVFAQAFKVVLVYYFEKNGCTFVPFLSLPNADNLKILGIGHVKKNHYIKLDFRYDFQLPPFPHTPSKWRTNFPAVANSWEELLAPEVSELQIDRCPGKTIPIEGEDHVLPSAPIQFQGKNFIDGISNSYPLEDVNELGDVILIDNSGANINILEDIHHRSSQSNVEHQDEGVNYLISNQEDHGHNEVNMQADMLYVDNQFTSQMEETAPPPGWIQTSERESAQIGLSDIVFNFEREFENIEAFRNSLSDWAMETGRAYRTVRKTQVLLRMKCVSEGCKWFVEVRQLPNLSTYGVVKKQDEHTCSGSQRSCPGGDHLQATKKWIVSKIQSSIEKNPDMEPMLIRKKIKSQFGTQISYNKAVKAKTMALNLMRKRLKDSYSRPHPDICHALIKELERGGTICRLGLSSDGSSFQHLFWAFPACVEALRNHLRPVIYVCSVKIEIGVLMCAYGIDGSGFYGEFIQVGFALCVREDEKTWETFLSWLKEFVLPPQPPPTFTIVTDFEKTALTRAVQNVFLFPHLHHFFSPDNFAPVFSEKCKDPNLSSLCWKACTTFSREKCEAVLQEIRRLNEEAYKWIESVGSKSHWAIAFSPNKHVWAFTKDEMEDEYFCSDLVSVLKNKWSIVEIVETSRDMVANYFSDRRMDGANMATTGLTKFVSLDIGWAKVLLPYYKVDLINGHKYQVTRNTYNYTWVVDLEERICTCGEYQATEYPCYHAFVVIVHEKLDVKDYLSHPWYSLDTYRATYSGTLPPPINVDISQWQTAFNKIPDLPPKRTQRGRPRKVPKISI